LLQYIATLGQITHFNEVIPSANDIFIETVNKNN
ncbi:MAG: ABC-2 type transport system ATP-binding protein, partial [Planctomycetota bacterium]